MAAVDNDIQRIGLFGGTFNPIHNGHLQVAGEVRIGFELDHILLIPSAIPPHKEMETVANADDRMAMIRLAIEGDPMFRVSDAELKRNGRSYTIDTVSVFKDTFPRKTSLFFILGLDAFLEIESWKSFRELFDVISMIVMSRGEMGKVQGWCRPQIEMEKLLYLRISNRYRFDEHRSAFLHPEKPPVFLFAVKPCSISSTSVRDRIKQGVSIKSLVPKPVRNYIKSKGLYR
jgi:nicotinate-nucleotide adenylyltransferase